MFFLIEKVKENEFVSDFEDWDFLSLESRVLAALNEIENGRIDKFEVTWEKDRLIV